MDALTREIRADRRELREELAELAEDVRGLGRRIDRTPVAARQAVEDGLAVNWRSVVTTLLAAATGIGAPIAAALILAPA